MTSQLIRSDLFNHPSSSIRAKVECCKSCDLFNCWVKDGSATRIPSSSITGHHPWPAGSLNIGGRGYSNSDCNQCILQPQPTEWDINWIMEVEVAYFIGSKNRIGQQSLNSGQSCLPSICTNTLEEKHTFLSFPPNHE